MLKTTLLTSHVAALAAILGISCAQDKKSLPAKEKAAITGIHRIRISKMEAEKIGNMIWRNECGGTVNGLTSWNKGEYFASLGIGHFIWYHEKKRGPFEESFPRLIRFMISQGIRVPEIATRSFCPWQSREEFLTATKSPQMRELRDFLHRTIPVQTAFILARLESALPKMLTHIPANQRTIVRKRFYIVAKTSQGKYALMDYVNFKGEGTNAKERYKGTGWGMLQVLQEMRDSPRPDMATLEYAEAADRVLTRRVANAPKDETKWLSGWRNRLQTYYK